MKSLLIAVLSAVSVSAFAEVPLTFRYASWNIGHYAYGRGKDTRVAPTNAVNRAAQYNAYFDKLNADVLGICEYSEDFTTDGLVKASKALFGRFPHQNIGPRESWQWNCSFSRKFRFIETRMKHYEKHHQDTYYVASRVDLGDGRDAWFVQTHLDWGDYLPGHHDDRLSQIRTLIADFRDCPRVVISGDFNTLTWHYAADEGKWWESGNFAEFDFFVQAGYKLAQDDPNRYTAPTHKPSSSIDNIIVRGFKVSDVDVVNCGDLSDHMTVICNLTVE